MSKHLHQTEIARNGKFPRNALEAAAKPAHRLAMDQLRRLRKARGLNQESLAAELGVATSTISRAETGKSFPEKHLLERIADYFGVTVAELLGEYRPPHGFAECGAEPLPTFPTRPGQNDISFILQQLAPFAKHPQAYRVTHDKAASFGLPKGTIAIVDLNRPARSGDLVIATNVHKRTGVAMTFIGRLHSDEILGPNFLTNPHDKIELDHDSTVVVGVVVGSYRIDEFA